MNLNNKVALITGGGHGIGGAIARCFARAGADLILVARNRGPLEETAKEAESLGRKVLVITGDVSQESIVRDVVSRGLSKFGSIDILVNNAGIEGKIALITDITREEWDQALSVNLTSAFLFCKYVMPVMKKKKFGSIINISSIAGTKGFERRSPYCTSKWGMIGLSRVAAEEADPYRSEEHTSELQSRPHLVCRLLLEKKKKKIKKTRHDRECV